MADPRKSVITKRITRKINTGPYETLDVSVSMEEEVEWNTSGERAIKTDKITDTLIEDFNQTLAKVMDELNLAKKGGKINIPNPENSSSNAKVIQNNNTINKSSFDEL